MWVPLADDDSIAKPSQLPPPPAATRASGLPERIGRLTTRPSIEGYQLDGWGSGAIDGEIAEAWTKKLEIEKEVKEMRAKAEGGDGNAMYNLGLWYEGGSNGLPKDDVQARAWHERSTAARDPMEMARFGEFLLAGRGGSVERTLGLVIVTEAATLGSDLAAWRLGESFLIGDDGLPKDPARARYWLKKVVDGECEFKHVQAECISKAAGMLAAE